MGIKSYDELTSMHLDVLKEIGSIGAGNAATALASTLASQMGISIPQVKILEYNEAIGFLGSPEHLMFGELVNLSGDIKGTMLYIQGLDFINLVLKHFNLGELSSLEEINEMGLSAVTEIGNIIIASYINAISAMTDIDIYLSVPATAVDMLGSIASIPMIEYGYESDSIMLIDVCFTHGGKVMQSSLILVPEVDSLNYLLKKLGIDCE